MTCSAKGFYSSKGLFYKAFSHFNASQSSLTHRNDGLDRRRTHHFEKYPMICLICFKTDNGGALAVDFLLKIRYNVVGFSCIA